LPQNCSSAISVPPHFQQGDFAAVVALEPASVLMGTTD
jgi:hypothetical protein